MTNFDRATLKALRSEMAAVLEKFGMSRSLFTDAYGSLISKLIAARMAAGLRQTDVAKRLGKPQSFVSKVETGERRLDVIEFVVVMRAVGADPVSVMREVAETVTSDLKI